MGKCIMKRVGSIVLSVVVAFASVNTTAMAQNNNSKAIEEDHSGDQEWNVQYNPELPVDELLGSHEKSDGSYLIFGKKNGKIIAMDGQYNYVKTLDIDSIEYTRGAALKNAMGTMTWLQCYGSQKGFFVAKKDEKIVLIDENLNEKNTEYNAISILKENNHVLQDKVIYKNHYLYMVAKAVQGVWYYGLVDDEGNEVMKPQFTYINNINTDQWGDENIICKVGCLMEEGVKYGISDLEGNIIVKPQYDDVTAICSLYSSEKDFRYIYMNHDSDGNEKFGVKDSKGKTVLEDEWDTVHLDNKELQKLSSMPYNNVLWPTGKINGETVTHYQPEYGYSIQTIDPKEILLADKTEISDTQVYVDGERWFSSENISSVSSNENLFSDEIYDTDCICKLKNNTSNYELLFYDKEGNLTQTMELSKEEVTSLQQKRREKIAQKVYEKDCSIWIDQEKEKLIQKLNDRCTQYGYKFIAWDKEPDVVAEKNLDNDYSIVRDYMISFTAEVEKNGETDKVTYRYQYDVNGHCVEGGLPVYGKPAQAIVPGQTSNIGYYNEDTKELLVKDSSSVALEKGSICLKDDPTENMEKWSSMIVGTSSGLLQYSGKVHDVANELTFDDSCGSFVKNGEKTLYYHKKKQIGKDRYNNIQQEYVYDGINTDWEIIKRSTVVSANYNAEEKYIFDDELKKCYILSGTNISCCDYADVGIGDKYNGKVSLYTKGNVSASWTVNEEKEWKVYYKDNIYKAFTDVNYELKNSMETGRYIVITFSNSGSSDLYYVIDKVDNTGNWIEQLPEKYQNISEYYSFQINGNEYCWIASNNSKCWIENLKGEVLLENLSSYFMVMKEYLVIDVGINYRLFNVYDSDLNLVAENVRPNDTLRLDGEIRQLYYTKDDVTMYVLWDIPKMELIDVVKGYPWGKDPYIVGNQILLLDDDWNKQETEIPVTSSPLQSESPASAIPTGGGVTPTVSPTSTILPVQSPETTVRPTEKPVKSPDTTVHPTEKPVKSPETTVHPTEKPVKSPDTTVSPTEKPVKSPEITVSPTEKPVKSPETTIRPTEKPINPDATVHPSQNPVIKADKESKMPETGTILYDQTTGNSYKVLNTGKSVSFEFAGKKKNITSVIIPDQITLNGKVYKVTKISDKAFCNCKKLKSVVIGKHITQIGKKAFYNCKQLKKIKIKTTLLSGKKVGAKAFYGIHKNATTKVPLKKVKEYREWLPQKGISSKCIK